MGTKVPLRISIVLTGYYFKYHNLYEKIFTETELYNDIQFNLYIVSHRTKGFIPKELKSKLIRRKWKLLYYPNIGWDWGCHAQFIQWHTDNNVIEPDYILFLHDDITILRNGFIQAFLDRTKQGFKLIGNSKPFTSIKKFKQDYLDEAYILSRKNIKFESNAIGIVRGSSFFMAFSLAKMVLLYFPYQKYGNINLANRSLRMFGAIVTGIVGLEQIGYLSKEHFKSSFIHEEMRGSNANTFFFIKRNFKNSIKKLTKFIDKNLISTVIYKHHYPRNPKNLIKVCYSSNLLKGGCLNYCVDNEDYSDINNLDIKELLSKDMIGQIFISTSILTCDSQWFTSLFESLQISSIPIDIFIEGEERDIMKFSSLLMRKKLNIKVERTLQNRGTQWKKRLYISHIELKQ